MAQFLEFPGIARLWGLDNFVFLVVIVVGVVNLLINGFWLEKISTSMVNKPKRLLIDSTKNPTF